MAIDGTVFDVPDTEANARVFGYPGTCQGTKAAFPKVRLVFLVELGTHLLTDALLSPYRLGERKRARLLLRSVGEGMLLMWDRGLHSFKMVHATLERKCHWEAENALDELKTHLNGRSTPIRSKKPREVVQEIYGWLLAHFGLRCLMFRAASEAGISPLRLGFTGTNESHSSCCFPVSAS